MKRSSFSAPIYFAQSILRHVEEGSDDWYKLLAGAGISPDIFKSPDQYARVSLEQLGQLESSTMLLQDDELLGYSSTPIPMGCWELMCQACISAGTLKEVIIRHCKFYNLLNWDMKVELIIEGESAQFRLNPCTEHSSSPFMFERSMHGALRFFCWIINVTLPVIRMNFPYPAPLHEHLYRVLFPSTPISFDQPYCSFHFQKSALSLPVAQTPLTLKKILRRAPYELMITASDEQSWSAKIQNLIHRNIVRMPSFEVLAENLNVRPQTLRRRLAEEGTSFRDIKKRLRRDTSIYYLSNPGLSIEEVAERSGFAETSSFIRAFKTWTGSTPHTYRKEISSQQN